MLQLRFWLAVFAIMGAAMLAACSGGDTNGSTPSTGTMPPMSANRSTSSVAVAADPVSILNTLLDEDTIGSTVDPATGDVNPYGLDIAKVSIGKITAGDLVVCDFNDSANVQGTGTAIIALHPVLGSKPAHIANSEELFGCDALAMAPNGTIWNSVFSDNDNPIFSGSGVLIKSLGGNPLWHHPFGETFVPSIGAGFPPAFYVSNAGDGSLDRVSVLAGGILSFTRIATGFPINGGAPGSILGPSGLNYGRAPDDTLYVVDGTNNTLYAINDISGAPANSLVVNNHSFSGTWASHARVVFSGAPLNGPISSARLFNGNIVLGNTLDPNGFNLMVEISPGGALLKVKNVDNGVGGAIFGMVASGTTAATTKVYFNDDNDNTTKVLEP